MSVNGASTIVGLASWVNKFANDRKHPYTGNWHP
jgi:hypothetical protein